LTGINKLKQRNIPFHVIAVLSARSLAYAIELHEFFAEMGPTEVGFNIEEVEGSHVVSTLNNSRLDHLAQFWQELYERHTAYSSTFKIREFDRSFRAIDRSRLPAELLRFANDQSEAFRIVSVDVHGNLSTFSPELLGSKHIRYESFSFGNVYTSSLDDIRKNPLFIKINDEIQAGVDLCQSTCDYFTLCGGGAPSNKLFENGTFASSETLQCRGTVKQTVDIVLSDLENRLGIASS
jgi:uncharacterized protein